MALLALHCIEESLCRSCVLKVASRSSLGMLRYVLVGSCAAAAAGSDPVQLVCPRYSGIRLYYQPCVYLHACLCYKGAILNSFITDALFSRNLAVQAAAVICAARPVDNLFGVQHFLSEQGCVFASDAEVCGACPVIYGCPLESIHRCKTQSMLPLRR